MTEQELAALVDLCEKTTPGPWTAECGSLNDMAAHEDLSFTTEFIGIKRVSEKQRDADLAFIAAARTALPALIAEVRRLRVAAAAQERLEAWNRVGHPVQRYVMITSCALCWVVRLADHSQNIEVSSVPRGENESDGSEHVGGRTIQPWRFWIDSSATLPEVINAALDEWERRYGGIAT